MKRRWTEVVVAAALALGVCGVESRAHAQCANSTETFITGAARTFTNGASWTFDIYRNTCEGLMVRLARFRPPGGVNRTVLSKGALAEVHVPYNTGSPRFFDVTTSTGGLGAINVVGQGALPLAAAECGGTRFDGNRICVENEDGEYAWKYGSSFKTSQAISVFMSSQLSEYNYIVKWTFKSDGTIEPSVGLTGRLEEFGATTAYLPYGSRLNAQTAAVPNVGKAHVHNFYYRLDFDVGDVGGAVVAGANDAVSRIQYNPSTAASPDGSCATVGTCGTTTLTRLLTEASNTISTTNFTSWFVFDKVLTNSEGRNIGYELVPNIGGLWRGRTTSDEPFAGADLWVTRFNGCERYAARNQTPFLPAGCAGAAANVQAMLNAQSVDGQDIVVWYVQRVMHYPRDEEFPDMPTEWTSFEIKPRNFFHTSAP